MKAETRLLCSRWGFFASHPVDHEEQGAVVGHRPHGDVESGDHAEFASPLHVVDECVARAVKQVAGDAALGKRQLVPEDSIDDITGRSGGIWTLEHLSPAYLEHGVDATSSIWLVFWKLYRLMTSLFSEPNSMQPTKGARLRGGGG